MRLEIIEGVDSGVVFHIRRDRRCYIGRDNDCDICINDVKSSRRHARIYYDSGYYLQDLKSTNGTELNDVEIQNTPLGDRDEIRIGDTVFLALEDDSSQVTHSGISPVKLKEMGMTKIISSLPQKEADFTSKSIGFPDQIDDLKLENASLRKIAEISQLVSSKKESTQIQTDILELLKTALNADTACILLRSHGESDWIVRAQVGMIEQGGEVSISKTIVNQAIDEGVAIMTTNPLSDERFDPSMSIISSGVSSALCSPLTMEKPLEGVLFFDRRNQAEVFRPMDLRLTATAANILGLFLQKVQLEEESRKKERLAVIGEVIAGLAHHTKNIITGLKFSISALEIVVKNKDFDRVAKCIQSIASQERRISDLVLNMLSYSKERVPIRKNLSLFKLIEDVVEPYRSHLKDKSISLIIECPEKLPLISAEETALHRMFLNLLVNAIDSFKEVEEDKEKKLQFIIEIKGKELWVCFKDTGCGISKDKVKSIFTVFFSTKGSAGTGLGLAVVQKIMNEHGGEIEVRSEEGIGTQFLMKFPFKTDEDTKK